MMKHDPDDIILWPDETWCFYSELWEFHWMSDDYEVISYGTDRWTEFLNTNESSKGLPQYESK